MMCATKMPPTKDRLDIQNIMLQPLGHQEILLLLLHAKNGGSAIFRRAPYPWRVPKHCGLPIPNGDIDGSIEELHILLIAKIPHSHPSAPRICPFISWPSILVSKLSQIFQGPKYQDLP
jgi:hypothetical protein